MNKDTIKLLNEKVPDWQLDDWKHNKHKWEQSRCKIDDPIEAVDMFGRKITITEFEHEYVKYKDTEARCYYCGKPKVKTNREGL